MTASDPKERFTIWRKSLIFIVAGNVGLIAATWLLSFLAVDRCLDLGGRSGRSWMECEFQIGEFTPYSEYVGAGMIAFSFAVWLFVWFLSHRVISKVVNRA